MPTVNPSNILPIPGKEDLHFRAVRSELAAVQTDLAALETTTTVAVTAAATLSNLVSATTPVTRITLTTTGATYALTVDAPTAAQRGKIVILEMIARGGSFNVTAAATNMLGSGVSGTGTFDAVRDTLVMVALADRWLVVANNAVTFA